MHKIFWLSRHNLSEAQVSDLERIYGEIEIFQYDSSVTSWQEVVEKSADCDILAVVLPPNLLCDLVNPRNNQKPVIRSQQKRIETGKKVFNATTGEEETEYIFSHQYWEIVKKIEIITEVL